MSRHIPMERSYQEESFDARETILGASGRHLIPKWPQIDPKRILKKHTFCTLSRIFLVFEWHKEDVKYKIHYIKYFLEDFSAKNCISMHYFSSFKCHSEGHPKVILGLNVFQKLQVSSPWHQNIPLDKTFPLVCVLTHKISIPERYDTI